METPRSAAFFDWPMKPLRGSGSEGSEGSKGSKGDGIAFGDEYEVSVTGHAFVSPVVHAKCYSLLP